MHEERFVSGGGRYLKRQAGEYRSVQVGTGWLKYLRMNEVCESRQVHKQTLVDRKKDCMERLGIASAEKFKENCARKNIILQVHSQFLDRLGEVILDGFFGKVKEVGDFRYGPSFYSVEAKNLL